MYCTASVFRLSRPPLQASHTPPRVTTPCHSHTATFAARITNNKHHEQQASRTTSITNNKRLTVWMQIHRSNYINGRSQQTSSGAIAHSTDDVYCLFSAVDDYHYVEPCRGRTLRVDHKCVRLEEEKICGNLLANPCVNRIFSSFSRNFISRS